MYFLTYAFQKMYLFLLFSTFSLNESYHIKINENVKLCIHCKNYKRVKNMTEEFGICKLFSPDINLITGKNLYYPAIIARKIDKLCGIDGKYFKNNNIDVDFDSNNNFDNNNF